MYYMLHCTNLLHMLKLASETEIQSFGHKYKFYYYKIETTVVRLVNFHANNFGSAFIK